MPVQIAKESHMVKASFSVLCTPLNSRMTAKQAMKRYAATPKNAIGTAPILLHGSMATWSHPEKCSPVPHGSFTPARCEIPMTKATPAPMPVRMMMMRLKSNWSIQIGDYTTFALAM